MASAYGYHFTKQYMLLGLIAALGIFCIVQFSIIALFMAMSVFIALWLINANQLISYFLAGFGLILYVLNLEFLFLPFWQKGGSYSLPESSSVIVLTSYFKIFFDPEVWGRGGPLGIIAGSMAYGIFLNKKINLKTSKNLNRYNGKSLIKQKPSSLYLKKETPYASEGSLIGKSNYGKTIFLNDKDANQHVLVLGTTGSGKTVTLSNIVESAIKRKLPLLYIDGKGDYDLAGRVCRYAQSQGRSSWLFGMNGDSVAYDPLACGGYTSKKDRIIELREWSEEHYKKLSEGYLQAVFKVLHALDIPTDLLSLSEHLNIKKLKNLVRENERSLANTQELMDLLSIQDQASKSIESLVAEINNFTHSEIGHLLKVTEEKNTLTLQKVIQQQGIAYFCLPALQFPSMSQTLGKLIINDLKATVSEYLLQTEKPKCYVIFDEFSVFAGEQILNLINMGRSVGIHAILATQSLSDIASGRKENADHFINQIVGNCNTFILHRQNAPKDAQTLAEMIGTRPSYEYTAQVSQKEATHMGTVRQSRGFLAHPDEIKSLETGEAFYVSKSNYESTRIKVRLSTI